MSVRPPGLNASNPERLRTLCRQAPTTKREIEWTREVPEGQDCHFEITVAASRRRARVGSQTTYQYYPDSCCEAKRAKQDNPSTIEDKKTYTLITQPTRSSNSLTKHKTRSTTIHDDDANKAFKTTTTTSRGMPKIERVTTSELGLLLSEDELSVVVQLKTPVPG